MIQNKMWEVAKGSYKMQSEFKLQVQNIRAFQCQRNKAGLLLVKRKEQTGDYPEERGSNVAIIFRRDQKRQRLESGASMRRLLTTS